MQSAARELASNASLAGIDLKVTAEPFGSVVSAVFSDSKCWAAKVTDCTWQLADWGSWTYAPDYLPTGDTLFTGGAPNNGGGYNDATDNQLINKTLQAKTPRQFGIAMHEWDTYVTQQLPVVYEPDQATLVETIKGLDTGPWNSADNITPEDWHYLK
jgi:peptide/nickel transport system substrate-binding protein